MEIAFQMIVKGNLNNGKKVWVGEMNVWKSSKEKRVGQGISNCLAGGLGTKQDVLAQGSVLEKRKAENPRRSQ